MKKISSKNPIIETVKSLLDRSCHMLVDSRSLNILLSCVKQSIEGMDEDDKDDDDDEMDGSCPTLSNKAKRGLILLKVCAFLLHTIVVQFHPQLLQTFIGDAVCLGNSFYYFYLFLFFCIVSLLLYCFYRILLFLFYCIVSLIFYCFTSIVFFLLHCIVDVSLIVDAW